jgi:hypothetical protein
MLGIGIAQKAEQRAHLHLFAVLHAMGGLKNLRQNALVLDAMLGQSGKSVLLQQLFLAPEVHARELDQPIENLADLFPPRTADRRQAKLVHRIHQNAVLVVHGSHAHRAGVIPGQKGHMNLRESLQQLSVSQGRMLTVV